MANVNKKKGVLGILTGGGDVPGLNPAIRAVTIRALRENATAQRDEEVERAMRLLHSGKDAKQVIAEMANRLTNKLIHEPSVQLKKAGYDNRQEIFDVARELFDLKDHER